MARQTPHGAKAVLAISDARRRIWQRLESDGLSPDDDETLLLIDTAAYWLNDAELARRKRQCIENYGEVNEGLLREERDMHRDFAHVRERIAA